MFSNSLVPIGTTLCNITWLLAIRVARWFVFKTKNPNLGKFWRALDWKKWIYFMAISNMLWTFGIFYAHLVHLVLIWDIFPVLVSWTKKNLATLLAKSFPGRPSCYYYFQGSQSTYVPSNNFVFSNIVI
jgi:hypothetical protein